MKVDLDELKRKANAAIGGEWAADRVPGMPREDEPIMANVIAMDLDERGRQQQIADCRDGTLCSDKQCEDNAAHIAANSPPVTLALIARIRKLEATVQRAVGYLQASSDKTARREWAAGLLEDLTEGIELP